MKLIAIEKFVDDLIEAVNPLRLRIRGMFANTAVSGNQSQFPARLPFNASLQCRGGNFVYPIVPDLRFGPDDVLVWWI